MATKKPTPEPISARLAPDQMRRGITKLQRRLEEVQAFDPQKVDFRDPSSSVRSLSHSIDTALIDIFGHESIEYRRFHGAKYFQYPVRMASHTQPLEIIRALTSEKRKSIDLLDAAIAMLKERLEDESEQPVGAPVTLPVAAMSRRIFVVHGHDDGQKETIARYLENIAFEPIILHERPNKGRTIIEKFRDEAADVGFAIALLTPDDAMADDNGSAKKRARQNVIFELGFFLGALGPGKVVALVKGPVEMPSDYHGVIYIPVDDGSWKMKVAQELQAANYDIDWNRVMR